MVKAAREAVERVALSVTLTLGLRNEVDTAARELGISRAQFVRQAIEEALEDLDDIRVCKARLADPNEQDIPWEVVRAEAGV